MKNTEFEGEQRKQGTRGARNNGARDIQSEGHPGRGTERQGKRDRGRVGQRARERGRASDKGEQPWLRREGSKPSILLCSCLRSLQVLRSLAPQKSFELRRRRLIYTVKSGGRTSSPVHPRSSSRFRHRSSSVASISGSLPPSFSKYVCVCVFVCIYVYCI